MGVGLLEKAGVSVEISIGWNGLFASRLTPTGFVC
ncbi:hypothetical protein PS843_05740 [Pseudomonas fluorescens]|nr:hypothetical protein PS843_05740 [Pseudomonas fluorescens]